MLYEAFEIEIYEIQRLKYLLLFGISPFELWLLAICKILIGLAESVRIQTIYMPGFSSYYYSPQNLEEYG